MINLLGFWAGSRGESRKWVYASVHATWLGALLIPNTIMVSSFNITLTMHRHVEGGDMETLITPRPLKKPAGSVESDGGWRAVSSTPSFGCLLIGLWTKSDLISWKQRLTVFEWTDLEMSMYKKRIWLHKQVGESEAYTIIAQRKESPRTYWFLRTAGYPQASED